MKDDAEKDSDDDFPRKLVFKKDKGGGKLRLAFKDGAIEVKLGKEGAVYQLSRKEIRKLALWLKWYAKLEMPPPEAPAPAPASSPES